MLLNIPQPKTEKDLQKALTSSVGAEVEMESENDQIANELDSSRKSLLTLLFGLAAMSTAPKSI